MRFFTVERLVPNEDDGLTARRFVVNALDRKHAVRQVDAYVSDTISELRGDKLARPVPAPLTQRIRVPVA